MFILWLGEDAEDASNMQDVVNCLQVLEIVAPHISSNLHLQVGTSLFYKIAGENYAPYIPSSLDHWKTNVSPPPTPIIFMAIFGFENLYTCINVDIFGRLLKCLTKQ